ncbi:DHA2 family efflux MFS transporter permease subunit [Martelella alba]|uniref:DHA2 family efflux MFS transporter permease subunit n=1 Tax=Martelella alba TaxID=2590451 RepID=A0ABY2SHN8_9HYPH|nr:DHA2 family efflux MFS transporter permease subunit [Martelella alba]TKI03784.1 DHA2 family efflux MFS transporter permease subunit [Martelella alba]
MRSGAKTTDSVDPVVWRVAAVVLIGSFMTQLDATVVNVSLSAVSRDLGSPIASAQWIVSGYLLAMALMLPLNGWLVDRVGAKRLYLGCFTAFTLASALCGASRTMDALIGARLFQGLAGGVLAPMAQMMIARVAGKNMSRIMGYVTIPILLAPVLGPVLAGFILAHAHWPWLFYLNVPTGVLGVGLAAWMLPADTGSLQKRPFDYVGFALVSPGLVAVIYGLQNVPHPVGLGVLTAGAVFLGGFLRHALRRDDAALIDVRLFANRTFSVAAATQFFANGIMFGRQLVVPLYLIAGCGLSTARAGELIAFVGLGMMCSFPLLGGLTDRYGCRLVSAGGALLALLSTLAFLWMIEHRFSSGWAAVSLFLAGAGQGTISIPSITAAYSMIPMARLAVANTALNIAQRVGGPVATTLLALAIRLTMHGAADIGPSPFLPIFTLLLGLHALTCLAACLLPLRAQRPPVSGNGASG